MSHYANFKYVTIYKLSHSELCFFREKREKISIKLCTKKRKIKGYYST